MLITEDSHPAKSTVTSIIYLYLIETFPLYLIDISFLHYLFNLQDMLKK